MLVNIRHSLKMSASFRNG